MVGVVRPDRCGTGRPIESLPPADRAVVEEFHAYLTGALDYDPATDTFVPSGTGVSRDQMKAQRETR